MSQASAAAWCAFSCSRAQAVLRSCALVVCYRDGLTYPLAHLVPQINFIAILEHV